MYVSLSVATLVGFGFLDGVRLEDIRGGYKKKLVVGMVSLYCWRDLDA